VRFFFSSEEGILKHLVLQQTQQHRVKVTTQRFYNKPLTHEQEVELYACT